MKTFKIIFIIAVLLITSAITAVTAQVTIGADNAPSSFSVLELISGGDKGLRLPQIETTSDRDAIKLLFVGHETEAMGLQIFNKETQCVETWNGLDWIAQCVPPVAPPIVVIPPGKGGDTWSNAKWVGAFWKDNQTGERIIASTNTAGVAWSASVDDENSSGSWLTLAANAGADPDLWTDNPGDAENYQLPSTRLTAVSGTGDILFRIGCTSTNPVPATPRYATVTLTVNGTDYKIFCRQGEAADYVFRSGDGINGGTAANNRNNVARFSPYNLTAASLPASPVGTTYYTDISVQVGVRGGVFVDYPTQAGAFWQWGTDKSNTSTYGNYIRRAYHPTLPASGAVGSWDGNYAYPTSNDHWSQFTGSDRLETCPNGWRRPMVGDTTTIHSSQAASGSELMQSLFYTTFDGYGNNTNSTNYRYFGYYADGFFDRRPIVDAVGSLGVAKSAVSVGTKDVAYIGLLFTNPATNASLFTPAFGYRVYSDGTLNNAGNRGYYWCSSAYNMNYAWLLHANSSNAYQTTTYRGVGFSVRCVVE